MSLRLSVKNRSWRTTLMALVIVAIVLTSGAMLLVGFSKPDEAFGSENTFLGEPPYDQLESQSTQSSAEATREYYQAVDALQQELNASQVEAAEFASQLEDFFFSTPVPQQLMDRHLEQAIKFEKIKQNAAKEELHIVWQKYRALLDSLAAGR